MTNAIHLSRLTRLAAYGGLLGSLALGTTALQAQTTPNFGTNVTIITPSMTPAQVTAALNAVNGYAQFDTKRAAVLFMPGTYGTTASTVYADVGFYESVAGLGASPNQVTITGGLVADQLISGNLTQNFWRSQENLTEVPVGGQKTGVLDWGVSQGASLRRLNVQGDLWMVNSNAGSATCAQASGGFTADTAVSGLTNACSQQQWYTRNSILTGGWQSNVWNSVFSGVVNAPKQAFPSNPNPGNGLTTLATSPVSREKPFLYVDASGNWFVFSPAAKTNSSGTSWSGGGLGAGTSLPISSFFIATPTSTLAQINQALQSGQNLILTPGIYQYSGSINVTNPNTVVLGMGYATLVPQSGTAALSVADVDGVQVAGLLIDAGPVNSPALLQVGSAGTANGLHTANPTSINDVFFRIGGSTLGSATTSLQVDSGSAILDNIWAWRADHGNAGTTGWTVNTAAHGLVVNGANVTALGLAVEHYQKEQVLWNGNGGETVFFQSELPYDPPSQSAWMSGTANGYPAYAVSPGVCTHSAYGLGIYSFFNQGVNIIEDNAITVPNVSGVSVIDAGTVFLSNAGSGQITNVVNGVGGISNVSNADILVPVASYVGAGTCVVAPPAAPAAPSGLQATAQPPQGSITVPFVQLTWNASTTPNVTYTIYRATGTGTATAIQNGVTTTNYNDQTIAASTQYTYYVVAVSGGTASAPSNSQTLTTAGAQVAPATKLTGTAAASQINLSWTASTTSGVTYTLYRATGSGGATALKSGITSTSYADASVVGGTSYTYDVVAVLTTGSNISVAPQSNAVTVQATAAASSADVAAIDAGSSTAVGSYIADATCASGARYNPSQIVVIPAATGAAAAPEKVYESACQGPATYTINGLVSGNTYNVVLHFAELYFTTAGSRKFNVAVNGTPVAALQNFDIFAAAGNARFTAVVETVPNVAAVNGQITIAFSNGAANQPMINGVEIQTGSGTSTPPPPPATLAVDAGSPTAVGNYIADPTCNAGATYNPGQTITIPSAVATQAAPEKVYESACQGAITYTLTGFTAGSVHTVNLHFAELYFTNAGSRQFNVAINGTPVTALQNFDIVQAAGGARFTAVVESVPNINAVNGQIMVTLSNGALNQPMINGISVQ